MIDLPRTTGRAETRSRSSGRVVFTSGKPSRATVTEDQSASVGIPSIACVSSGSAGTGAPKASGAARFRTTRPQALATRSASRERQAREVGRAEGPVRLGELLLAALVLGEPECGVQVAGVAERAHHALGPEPRLHQEVHPLDLRVQQRGESRGRGRELVIHPPLPDRVLAPDDGGHHHQRQRRAPRCSVGRGGSPRASASSSASIEGQRWAGSAASPRASTRASCSRERAAAQRDRLGRLRGATPR